MYVQNLTTLLNTIAEIIAMSAQFNGAKIALYTNDIYPSRTNVVGDFTIADFGGLTNQKAITWGTQFANAQQQAEVLGGLLTWLTTASTGLPQTAYGYVILKSDASDWLLAERFATPFQYTASGQQLSIVPRMVYDT